MTTVFVTTMLVVANVLGGGMALPQAVRLIRTRSVEGVSAVWAGVSISMNVWWLVYGIANGLWGLVPVSAIAVVLYSVITAVYLSAAGLRSLGPIAFGALSLGAVPLPVLLVAGWPAAGVTIGLCYGLQLAPAVVAACRTRDLSGVAPVTWLMACAESVIWFGYGLLVTDGALLLGGGTGTVMASIILVRLVATGHPLRRRRVATWAVA